MKPILTLFVAFLLLSDPARSSEKFKPAWPEFEDGTVNCIQGMAKGAVCRRLASDFAYERGNKSYEARAGLVTDGASIPDWAKPLIGESWDYRFVRAAILHDYYSRRENYVLSYLTTQQLFYWALVDSGVDAVTSRIMYAAVLLGAPKWSQQYKRKPEPCKMFSETICVRNDGSIRVDGSLNYIEQVYDTEEFINGMKSLKTAAQDESISIEELERIALGTRIILGFPTPLPAVYGDQK